MVTKLTLSVIWSRKALWSIKCVCIRRILGITWTQRVTNKTVVRRITCLIGQYEPVNEVVRRRKLQWFGHVTTPPGALAHTIMHGNVEGQINRGRPRRTWLADISKWTGHFHHQQPESNGEARSLEKEGDDVKVPQRSSGHGNNLNLNLNLVGSNRL